MHADHTTLLAHITLPSEGRGLLDGHAELHVWRQHAVPILLCLVFKNVPGRHRDHPCSDALLEQPLIGFHNETNLAARSDQDQFGIPTPCIG